MVHCQQEAEDIIQEILIKIWNNRSDLSNVRNLEAWGISMTRNYCIDVLRSKRKKTAPLEVVREKTDPSQLPDRQLESKDTFKQIENMIESLPIAQANVFRLRELENLSYQEIAEQLQISLDQVKVNLHRARKSIRYQLIKRNENEI